MMDLEMAMAMDLETDLGTDMDLVPEKDPVLVRDLAVAKALVLMMDIPEEEMVLAMDLEMDPVKEAEVVATRRDTRALVPEMALDLAKAVERAPVRMTDTLEVAMVLATAPVRMTDTLEV